MGDMKDGSGPREWGAERTRETLRQGKNGAGLGEGEAEEREELT